jgi:hypothetical protein
VEGYNVDEEEGFSRKQGMTHDLSFKVQIGFLEEESEGRANAG